MDSHPPQTLIQPLVQPLISADDLRVALAGSEAPLVIDTGFDLADTDAGERAWRDGHLPGSVYLHLERDLSGAKTAADGSFRGRHPLPDPADFCATLARIGVTPGRPVVALDRQGGVYAARLWWMLRRAGHADARVLDGGLEAWREVGGGLTDDSPPVAPAAVPYPECEPLQDLVEVERLARSLGSFRLIDARAGERFRGEVEPIDPVAGHIPGALNRCFKDNLTAGGRFKPADILHAEFAPLVADRQVADVVHQCGSGVTACHNLLAMEHAGWHGSLLYPGSWSEWSADPARPIARG